MKLAFLFAGQGAQKVGMGLDIYQNSAAAHRFLDELVCDFDVKSLMFNGPIERLNQTEFTQVSVLLTSLMIAEALREEGIEADAVAGLSLGEYSALGYANVFKLDELIPLVQARGLLMAQALPHGSSGMAALLSSDITLIHRNLNDARVQALGVVDIANYNSPNQTVISGETVALSLALQLLKEQGIRSIPLAVSGAFHSRLLIPSATVLKQHLERMTLLPATKDVYFNVDGQLHNDVVSALVQQIHSSVQWVNTINTMASDGVTHFVEIGPGRTLSKFVHAINPSHVCMSVETMEDIKSLKGALYG